MDFVCGFIFSAGFRRFARLAMRRIISYSYLMARFLRGNVGTIYLTSLTLANLVMIASAFLLPRFSQNLRFLKYWRVFSFLALALVWSYVFLLFTHNDRKDMKIGCYVWTASFLLLFLSTLKLRHRKASIAAPN
jgi:hypothetical protein